MQNMIPPEGRPGCCQALWVPGAAGRACLDGLSAAFELCCFGAGAPARTAPLLPGGKAPRAFSQSPAGAGFACLVLADCPPQHVPREAEYKVLVPGVDGALHSRGVCRVGGWGATTAIFQRLLATQVSDAAACVWQSARGFVARKINF